MALPNAGSQILLVDDDPSILAALERVLRRDFKISTATTIEEAKAQLLGHEFELALIDFHLKGGSSLDLFRELRSQRPSTTRVLISGDLNIESLAQSLDSSLVHKVLQKPWDPQALALQIKEARQMHQLLKEKERLEQASTTDAMTGLFNYRYLQDRLNQELARAERQNRPLSVIMLDLDGFKKWNDQNGHPAGDKLLREVAQLLRENVRSFDSVCRYGGDEFCILLQETGLRRAQEIAERLRGKAEKESPLTFSLGVSTFPQPSETAEKLLADADAALYKAKSQGRNRCVIAETGPAR